MSNVAQKWYVGMDVSEKKIDFFFLPPDDEGEGIHKVMPNKPDTLCEFCDTLPDPDSVVIAMETGTHSPWMSEYFERRGIKCYVGNARKLAAVWSSVQKSDRKDAEMLARLARADLKLFCPIKHANREFRIDAVTLKMRHRLVLCRTTLTNCIRGNLRSFGIDTSSLTPENFSTEVAKLIPPEMFLAMEGVLVQIKMLTQQIKSYDRQINKLCKKYEQTKRLQQIPGVGPVIALAFVLTIIDPERFGSAGRVASYTGLVPKRDQSGDVDKQLGITKAGNKLLRQLLLQGANYIISRAPDCELRQFAERLAERGGKIARRKAKVALARKLCETMYSMWKNETDYNPFYKAAKKCV